MSVVALVWSAITRDYVRRSIDGGVEEVHCELTLDGLPAVDVNDVVRIIGDDLVGKALAENHGDPALGVVVEHGDSGMLRVRTHGRVSNFSTGMPVGKYQYLSKAEAGQTQSSKPPGNMRQIIGIALSSTDLFVAPGGFGD